MAEVFRVRGTEGRFLGKEYALKRLLPTLEADAESVRLFKAEAELSRHLHHPNIVEVHDVGGEGDSIYMVMDFIDGRDVGQILKRCRQKKVFWPVDFAVYLTRALLDALEYAHHATDPQGQPLGIIHCDVSPSNFFVSRTGELKLGDFGVARSLLEGGADQVMGKPYYLSPEALEGALTPQVDLWAVAVTLYELITLQRPFLGKTPEQVFDAIRHSRYAPVEQVREGAPPVIDGLLARAFDADPTHRYASAAEFARALTPLYDERVGTPLAISAVVRGLFGTAD
ncbi:MAG: serine/threonine protein kinase [Myxococcaceae bacterium]|nr:serine/threonine protein kinase [Myxococcaceae bacterium]